MKKKTSGKSTPKSMKVMRSPRNRVAQNPLLGKGGPHVRAKSAERFSQKQKARKEAREWQGSRGQRACA
ncbi:hypothetical protein [Microbulbifer sp. HZ11]|uniref:hypothetical protein n=1 Tax=unclassified Microbulbifer TaxID=2619833 RepID=UPI0005BC4F8A|nr:hypothetical protein [Microbulbifer sp. HZ11]